MAADQARTKCMVVLVCPVWRRSQILASLPQAWVNETGQEELLYIDKVSTHGEVPVD